MTRFLALVSENLNELTVFWIIVAIGTSRPSQKSTSFEKALKAGDLEQQMP